MDFGRGFRWGAATASFQIEGGYEDRDECIWDVFCRTDGKVAMGHDGKTACDHYHRFREDIKYMKEIGINSYRFSLSWPRLIHEGTGKINMKGVKFYNALINELIANDIEPYVTLFHWDFPYALYKKGGWLNPESPKWFAYYTKIVMDLFSDRVSHWFTLNENLCFISIGHANGEHAPGLKLSEEQVMLCAHHSLLAHGAAVQIIRAFAKKKPLVGFAPVGDVKIPASNSMLDIAAARKAMFSDCNPHYWGNMIWVDPIMTGKYSNELMNYFEKNNIKVTKEAMQLIGSEIDFMGMNIYQGTYTGVKGDVKPKIGYEQTAMGWPITPEALYWGPKFCYERYKKPIYITENGMANIDIKSNDGMVHDPQRIEYTRRYLTCLKQAIKDGVDVRGYFHWSLLDNFEWAEGYQKRFGLIHVDYESGTRTLKDSAYWYRDVIAENGANL